jgi:hypothetical protein
MFARIGNAFLILALLGATGAHWALLQSVAWATMLADHARTENLSLAIVKTFDGKHPCALCKEVAQGRQNEKRKDAQTEIKRLEFFHPVTAFFLGPPCPFSNPMDCSFAPSQLTHSPPVPPPRNLPV